MLWLWVGFSGCGGNVGLSWWFGIVLCFYFVVFDLGFVGCLSCLFGYCLVFDGCVVVI